MDKPIRVGDLVQVVRSCCTGYLDAKTPIFTLAAIENFPPAKCAWCGFSLPDGAYGARKVGKCGFPIDWLKRIPPLEELETVRTEDEVTA